MSTNQVQEGDKVSWSWNGNNPSGVASEIKPGGVTVVSHRGNEITKTGTESDPAVHIERSGNDVVKTVSELHVEKKGEQNGTSEKQEESMTDEKKEEFKPEENKAETNGEEAQADDKKKADEKVDAPAEPVTAPEEKDTPAKEEPEAKKQKTTTDGARTNGNKKGPGRPKGGEKKASGPKKEKKVLAVGKAARQTRSQGKTGNEAL